MPLHHYSKSRITCVQFDRAAERTHLFPKCGICFEKINRVVKIKMKRHARILGLAGCTDGVALLQPDSRHVLTFNMI